MWQLTGLPLLCLAVTSAEYSFTHRVSCDLFSLAGWFPPQSKEFKNNSYSSELCRSWFSFFLIQDLLDS